MRILHIHLTQQGKDYIALRYFGDNPFDYQEHRLPLIDVEALHRQAETDYYTRLPVDYAKTGQALYQWLDQSDRLLSNALQQIRPEGLILAIASDEGLAQLPWELLHDGQSFLVQKHPPVIPIRWLATEQVPIAITYTPQNRPLNVLFMATSPLGVEPVLDYEAEEGQILTATQRTPVNLRVEESGCLSELGYLVGDYETGYFDVFHLIGHATAADLQPYFITESEYGDRVNSSAEDLVDALGYPLPPLIFLSGCQTGYSSDRAIPSMAESLLRMGASAVLGWGDLVRDADATASASALYQKLATGRTVSQAIAATHQTLIQQQTRDWHKLRLYVGTTLPAGLVTPPRTKGRKQLPKPSIKVEFRDDEARLRVASRETFVGRRRQLQNCLRTLKTDTEKVGVLIYGMGGWGKSSIASRLWERLPEYEKVLWWRQLNEPYLIQKLKDKLIHPTQLELSSYLENRQLPLKARLTYMFGQLAEMGEKPFLLILDDFEWNLEPRAGHYSLKPEVAPLLAALVEAIQEAGTDSRILMTCRYEFDADWLEQLFLQGLEPLKKAELTKKLNRLEQFRSSQLPDAVRDRALALADGNPRLLEFLNDDVLGKADAEVQLTELEQRPDQWRNRIIWEDLYQLIDQPLQRVLSHCLVYELPVPMAALEAVCQILPNYQQQLQRGRELGLLEVSAEAQAEKQVFRVPRILPQIIPSIQLPNASQLYEIYRKSSEKLHELWGNRSNKTEEEWREIFRLLFLDKENPLRFRKGFSWMQYAQVNIYASSAYKDEVRKFSNDLLEDEVSVQLEIFLKDKNWQESDFETAWILYKFMIKRNYDMDEVYQCFSSQILKAIDQLWLHYSNGNLGLSVQRNIYQSLGEKTDDEYEIREKFAEYVGWLKRVGDEDCWLEYEEIASDPEHEDRPCLPYLLYWNGKRVGIVNNRLGWIAQRRSVDLFLLSRLDW